MPGSRHAFSLHLHACAHTISNFHPDAPGIPHNPQSEVESSSEKSSTISLAWGAAPLWSMLRPSEEAPPLDKDGAKFALPAIDPATSVLRIAGRGGLPRQYRFYISRCTAAAAAQAQDCSDSGLQ